MRGGSYVAKTIVRPSGARITQAIIRSAAARDARRSAEARSMRTLSDTLPGA